MAIIVASSQVLRPGSKLPARMSTAHTQHDKQVVFLCVSEQVTFFPFFSPEFVCSPPPPTTCMPLHQEVEAPTPLQDLNEHCSTKTQRLRQTESHCIVAPSALDELSPRAHRYVSYLLFFFLADQPPLLLHPIQLLPLPSSTNTEVPPSSCHSWTPHVCTC